MFLVESCLFYWHNPWGHKIYATVMFVFFYLIPQCILTVCYFQIGHKLWFSVRLQGQTRGGVMRRFQKRRRVVKMMIILTVIFALSWLPGHLTELYIAFSGNFSTAFYELKVVTPMVPHLFIAMQPICHCLMSEVFRSHIKAGCKYCWCFSAVRCSCTMCFPENRHERTIVLSSMPPLLRTSRRQL